MPTEAPHFEPLKKIDTTAKKTKKDEIKELLTENPDLNQKELAKKFKTTEGTIKTYLSDLRAEGKVPPMQEGWRQKPPEEEKEKTFDEQIEDKRDKAKIKRLHQELKASYERYDLLMEQYDNALMLSESTVVEIPKIIINPNIKNQAVPIVQWSDWHVEEKIERKTTKGLNEYNPDIAKKRSIKLVENLLKIIKKERQSSVIDEIIINLGGDFINNFLHEHDVQMNYMHPIEASTFAKELLKKALLTVAKYGNFKKIIVLCIRGNHGRQTKKMQSSNDYKMNLEAIIYYMLKQELNDSIFEWHIPESELGSIEVFGKNFRAFHGHQCKYQGGVGDLGVPLNKLIMKWDKTEKAYWNLMSHFHRLMMPTSNCSLNGSMCGYNSYALGLGFQFEPPLQAFQLMDAKYGMTVRIPLFCE